MTYALMILLGLFIAGAVGFIAGGFYEWQRYEGWARYTFDDVENAWDVGYDHGWVDGSQYALDAVERRVTAGD